MIEVVKAIAALCAIHAGGPATSPVTINNLQLVCHKRLASCVSKHAYKEDYYQMALLKCTAGEYEEKKK